MTGPACTVWRCGRPRMSMRNRYCLAHHRIFTAAVAGGDPDPHATVANAVLKPPGRPKTMRKTCARYGCRKPAIARDLCDAHYRAQLRAEAKADAE